ncbi:MAG TPA: imelysin family protein [Dongiaceae bacterium]|nr:imelysin family protein [Dongiaceae bacterium]
MKRLFIAGLLLGCATTPALAFTDADYATAMGATARNTIIPGYKSFQAAADNLRDEAAALCAAPSAEQLAMTQNAFAATATQWARLQFFTLGAISVHQRAARIQYWPDKRNVVGRQLSDVLGKQDPAALAPERFATTSVGVQGLPAMERLLFDNEALQAVAKDAPGAAFRCGVMKAIGDNLHTIAGDVLADWTGGEKPMLDRIEHPDPNDELMPSARDAAGRLLNDMLTTTIAVRDMKLLVALGASLEKAKPQQAEFWRSGQSLAMVTANIEGLRDLFGNDAGLAAMLRTTPGGDRIAKDFAAAIDAALAAKDKITLPLGEAAADAGQRPHVEELAVALVKLRDLLAGPVAANLNLAIGFNALDGD